MKRINIFPMLNSLTFFSLMLITIVACNSHDHPQVQAVQYNEATQELVNLVNSDTALKSMLTASIEKAKQINPDTNTNPVQSLDQFYAFASRAEKIIPWFAAKTDPHLSTMENTFRFLCHFYFVVDQPLPELAGKGYFNNSLQYAPPFANWLTRFNRSWSKYLDSEKSWNDSAYQMVLHDSVFGLQRGWYEDPSHWKTFNQFFSRQLSSPAARPIASPDDNSVITSYADAEPQGVWTIDSNSNIADQNGVAVKTATIKSVQNLLGDDSQFKNAFAGGTFTHSFLDVNDYHRFHFPVSGTIKEARIIQGLNPTGGTIGWNAEQKRYLFNPSSVGWQMVETRGCVIVETEKYGLVALLPIGMAVVGSVHFMDNIKVGTKVKKGDMLGYFLFGGSDFIMIFQQKVKFTLDAPHKINGNGYRHLLMGERLGKLTRN